MSSWIISFTQTFVKFYYFLIILFVELKNMLNDFRLRNLF